jgi:hypothetical protein
MLLIYEGRRVRQLSAQRETLVFLQGDRNEIYV